MPLRNENDKDKIERRLFDVSIDLLREVDRRDFYARVVEFCADLLESEVCALFVRTRQIDEKPRACLVSGKLPPVIQRAKGWTQMK